MVEHFYASRNDAVLTYKQEDFPEGVGVYDVECGRFEEAKPFPWQTDDRLEDNVTWCMVQEPKYKSACRIIHQLCDIVAKNGNLLLNVGPYADGSFHPDAVRQLEKIGDWLRLNGEAIYGTRPFQVAAEGPTKMEDANYDIEMVNAQLNNAEGDAGDVSLGTFTAEDFRFTQKGDTAYAIGFAWPQDGIFRIHGFSRKFLPSVSSVFLLGCPQPLAFTQTDTCLEVRLPAQKPCSYAYVIKALP
jgi:alpha-L-fucosidase